MGVRYWLKANGMTQYAFAKRIGISRHRLNHYCTGKVAVPGWVHFIMNNWGRLK